MKRETQTQKAETHRQRNPVEARKFILPNCNEALELKASHTLEVRGKKIGLRIERLKSMMDIYFVEHIRMLLRVKGCISNY